MLQGTHKKFGMEQVCQMASNTSVLAAVLVIVTSKRVKMRHGSECAENELRQYEAEDAIVLDSKEGIVPLLWWKKSAINYNYLS